MSIDRSRRTTFEEMADLYNEIRPNYPESLVDAIITLSGIPQGGRILEIGCGTGQATESFARRGYAMVAVELGERLAAFAAQNLKAYPKVTVVNASFEDWPLEKKAFDLVISADAFHWIPPQIGYPKIAQALKETGAAALFWNLPAPQETALAQNIVAIYRELGLEDANPEGKNAVTSDFVIHNILGNFEEAGVFDTPMTRLYDQATQTLTSEQHIKLLRTFSGHRDIPHDLRETLYQKIDEAIIQAGGMIELHQKVVLVLAKLKRPV